MFFRIKPDVYSAASILQEPSIVGFDETFMTGSRLAQAPPTRMIFRSNYDAHDPPRAFVGMSIPLWSDKLIKVLHDTGVNNFHVYDATITGDAGVQWLSHHAVNILGLLAVANTSKSRVTKISGNPSGGPQLMRFHELVMDTEKALGLDLFRLAEDPSEIVVSQRVVDALKADPPTEGWGISAFPIEESV